MSALREALARLLRDAERSVKHTCGMVGSDDCLCDYRERVRLCQAAVMEAVVGWYASEPSKYDTIDGRLRMALAAGQAHLTTEKR